VECIYVACIRPLSFLFSCLQHTFRVVFQIRVRTSVHRWMACGYEKHQLKTRDRAGVNNSRSRVHCQFDSVLRIRNGRLDCWREREAYRCHVRAHASGRRHAARIYSPVRYPSTGALSRLINQSKLEDRRMVLSIIRLAWSSERRTIVYCIVGWMKPELNINICSIELTWDGKITKIWYDNEMRWIRITVWNGGDL